MILNYTQLEKRFKKIELTIANDGYRTYDPLCRKAIRLTTTSRRLKQICSNILYNVNGINVMYAPV